MRKLKTLLLTALSLAAVGFVAPKTSASASADTRDFLCQYSARVKDTEYMTFGSSEVKTYTAEEAEAADIPAGYENEVFEIAQNAGASCGVFLDFEQEQVPIALIESLQFRIYVVPHASNTGSRPQARITDPTDVGQGWIYQPGSTPTPAGEWTTVTVPYADKFANIAKDGLLDKFEFGVRMEAYSPVYVDSISYVLKANDGVAPVISGVDGDTVAVGLDGALPFTAVAFDAQDNRNVAVECVWEDGVTLNANGTPNATGTYTLTLQAKDYYGNLATKTLTVSVIEEDHEAPVIDLNFDTVKTTVGTKPMLDVTVTDDSGIVTVTKTWSEGALDGRGRLTEGTHTWTVTAKDAFGNTTEKTLTWVVTEDEPAYNFVTNEENLTPKRTVTFDGENAVSVSHGFIMDKPQDPVKEDAAAGYTFIGWYNGEEEWNFDNPVTEDMDLTSKWDAQKRLYRVYIDGNLLTTKLYYGDLIPADDIPADPQKASDERYHYVFAGWYNGDELWDFETSVITGETQLVARFEKEDRIYTVTFDGEDAQQVKYGEKLTEPAVPEKEGYIFEGWYSGIVKWNFEKNVVRSDMTLTAKWKSLNGDSSVGDSAQDSADGNTDSDTVGDASDTSQPGQTNILSGCFGAVGGITGGLTALCAAVVALKKKKD